MAKMKVGAAGIETISGAMKRPKKQNGHNHGNYLVAVHRVAPTTNPNCQRVYSFDADRYNVPLSQTELAINARNRFTAVSQAIKARKRDLSKLTDDQQAFLAQRDLPNGKKTMLSYYWLICGAEYDAQHNG